MPKFWDNADAVVARTGETPVPTLTVPTRARVFPAGLKIGNVEIAPATVLAPMSGVTDTVFRRFIKNLGGCGLIMTEFTSADGVLRDQRVRGRYLHFYEDEHPVSAQLFGSSPSVLADAARLVEDLGFDLVDLNLGCPAKKVVRCNGGSGLLRDLPLIRQIFEAVRAAVKIPFTVKFRAGWNDDEIVCVELARMAESCGLGAVALHARTREQGYSGNARWEWIASVKQAVKIPVIASLNGTSRGGWTRYARMMQDAGADALELNIYFVAADLNMTGQEVEARYLDLVAAVKKTVSIPLAVKVGPYFSSMGNMAKRLVDAGADGLVLFNRFLQPDFDLESLETKPKLVLSTPFEMLLPLRWIAILRGRLNASLALTSGLHDASGLIKALLAGADVGMVVSTVYEEGSGQVSKILSGLRAWMEEKEYDSVEQLKGSMSQENCAEPAAFERGNYMKALTSFTGRFI